MATPRVLGVAETVATITGAVLVGDALRRSFVLGTTDPGAPATLIRVVVGVLLVAAGYTLFRRRATDDSDGSGDPTEAESTPESRIPDRTRGEDE